MQDAADIAAFCSKGRQSTNVPVGYCNPKYIRRPKGSRKVGLVEVSNQDGVLFGSPERGKLYIRHQH